MDLSERCISSLLSEQLLLMLEGLVAERNRLNEALQAERQLYSSLVKFHTHPDR